MNECYAEAIEQQVALNRWLSSGEGAAYMVTNYSRKERREALRVILRTAEPYYWAPPICALVTDATASLPDWELRPEDLPTEAGFFWYADPLPLPGALRPELVNDAKRRRAALSLPPDDLRGIAWHRVGLGAGIQMTWDRNGGERAPAGVLLYALNRTGYRAGGLPSNTILWPYGTRLTQMLLSQAVADDPWADYSPEDTQARLTALARYFATCVAFTNDVLEARPTAAPRATRRRLQHLADTPSHFLEEPTIRVVTLRRKVTRGEGAATPVEWSCQWQVAGHWRNQFYPSEGRHRAKWIAPFWKGDPTKPIKPPGPRLFQVVR
jgi:hypothetical protein